MLKKITWFSFLGLGVIILSGCGSQPVTDPVYVLSGVMKTIDGGDKWEIKTTVNKGEVLIAGDVLSLEIDPVSGEIYVGTEKDGLFKSTDKGATWKRMNIKIMKAYGLSISQSGGQAVYVSGVLDGRAKIFKSVDGGVEWKEIYTEPANGSVITSLRSGKNNESLVYAGTDSGMIIKSVDGGKTWKNAYAAEAAVYGISFDAADSKTVYFGLFGSGVLLTRDGGETLSDITKAIEGVDLGTNLFSVMADPSESGTSYVGLKNGMARGTNFGANFEKLNTLESTNDFPMRAIAINPKNSKEVFYNVAQAIYKSVDRGNQWSSYQINTNRTGYVLKYDPLDPQTVYLGLRKIK
jgi:photosystem II stability/assembly factor-like uncharacterized protein